MHFTFSFVLATFISSLDGFSLLLEQQSSGSKLDYVWHLNSPFEYLHGGGGGVLTFVEGGGYLHSWRAGYLH